MAYDNWTLAIATAATDRSGNPAGRSAAAGRSGAGPDPQGLTAGSLAAADCEFRRFRQTAAGRPGGRAGRRRGSSTGLRCLAGRNNAAKKPRRTTVTRAVTGIRPGRPSRCRPVGRVLVIRMLMVCPFGPRGAARAFLVGDAHVLSSSMTLRARLCLDRHLRARVCTRRVCRSDLLTRQAEGQIDDHRCGDRAVSDRASRRSALPCVSGARSSSIPTSWPGRWSHPARRAWPPSPRRFGAGMVGCRRRARPGGAGGRRVRRPGRPARPRADHPSRWCAPGSRDPAAGGRRDAVVVNDIPLLTTLAAAAAFHLVIGVQGRCRAAGATADRPRTDARPTPGRGWRPS